MSIRETMNNNPAMVTIGAVVVLVLCLGAIMCQVREPSGGQGGAVQLYFLDEGTGMLFTAESKQQPPIVAPSDTGGSTSGVRAHVLSCGDCPGNLDGLTREEVQAQGAFIGYLEKYTPEAKAAMEQAMSGEEPDIAIMYEMDKGKLMRMPDSDQWIDANSERAVDVHIANREQCPGDVRPRQCFPNR
ncbi:MAG: hypothetical protein GVY24_05485 [Planctomycetes bacterium]|jgi:hypothetical protein|nr:hypothetical protein [Planctomycetota bacterium]